MPRELYDRAGLLLGQLCAEAVPRGAEAQAAVYGAAVGGGRYARFINAESSVIAVNKPAPDLTRADARSYACSMALWIPAFSRGMMAPIKAAGFATTMEYFGLVRPHRCASQLFSLSTGRALHPKRSPYLIARAGDVCRADRLPDEDAE